MRFVKRIDSVGKAYVYLDLGKIEIPNVEIDIEPLKCFRIETYAVLKAGANDFEWNVVFSLVHRFFKTMTPDELQKFATMIVYMHYEILLNMGGDRDLDGPTMTALESRLSQLLAEYDLETNLMNRLVEFTQSHIPIQLFNGVGERAQDTAEMTFYRDDVVKLTAVFLLCKMMTPILGIFIESCKKRMDNAYKEIHAVAILKDILSNRMQPLIDKLQNFISRIIKPMLNNKVNLTHIYNGFTFNVILQQIWGSMMTRRSIAVDLEKPNGNLITYVTSCARAAAQTQFSSTGFKTAVAEIISPKDQASEEEGNVSTLEAESKSSTKTSDFGLIIKAAVLQLRTRFVVEHGLDAKQIDAAIAYYEINHVALTPCNSYLLGTLFDSDICGARSIEMLDGADINILIPIMQAYFIQQGYPELVHAVSVQPTGISKTFLTGSDMQLRSSWNTSFEYRNCDTKLPYGVNDLKWDTGLKDIVDNFTSEELNYNTAPVFWDAFQDAPKNGELYTAPDGLARTICALISTIISV